MKHPSKILVPVDFSEGAAATLKNAAHLAALYKAELLVLHVIPILPNVYAIAYGVSLGEIVNLDEVRSKSNAMLDEFCKANIHGGIPVKKIVVEGRVEQEINQIAETEKADLVMMYTEGSAGKESGLMRKVLGTHASRVLSHAPCPVMSFNDAGKRVSYKKILIPVERRYGIRELRRYLRSYFSIMDPEVHLVSILNAGADQVDDKDERHFLAQEVAFFAKEGTTKVTTEVAHSADVSGEILRTADAIGAELIMMNTHGRSGLGRLVSGSVTESVVANSPYPVFTLRPGRGEVEDFVYHSWFPV